ncbi:hypothetical protein HYR99_16680 [Candidatus Poribacteria bacterium]|nr:hypothetical protein [Candidatus Poribacteria bacterium]
MKLFKNGRIRKSWKASQFFHDGLVSIALRGNALGMLPIDRGNRRGALVRRYDPAHRTPNSEVFMMTPKWVLVVFFLSMALFLAGGLVSAQAGESATVLL